MALGGFLIGLLTGLAASGVAGAGAGLYAYRRFVLLERRARQAERLAELGTLTGGLAHEIKNPLSTVQLNLQLLGEELDGRDPHQQGRVATSLELFYDLVFVVAFSIAGTQVAHQLAEGHFQTATFGFVLCTFHERRKSALHKCVHHHSSAVPAEW